MIVPDCSLFTYCYNQTLGTYFDQVKCDYVNTPPLNMSMDCDLAAVCYGAMWTFALTPNKTIMGK